MQAFKTFIYDGSFIHDCVVLQIQHHRWHSANLTSFLGRRKTKKKSSERNLCQDVAVHRYLCRVLSGTSPGHSATLRIAIKESSYSAFFTLEYQVCLSLRKTCTMDQSPSPHSNVLLMSTASFRQKSEKPHSLTYEGMQHPTTVTP